MTKSTIVSLSSEFNVGYQSSHDLFDNFNKIISPNLKYTLIISHNPLKKYYFINKKATKRVN